MAASGEFNVISGAYTGNASSVATIISNNSNTGFWWSNGAAASTQYYDLSFTAAGGFSTSDSKYLRNYLPIRCVLNPDLVTEGVVTVAMQSINASNKNTLCPSNAETEVYDNRDNKVYTITQIDGVCTMTKNLQYTGGSNGTVSKTSAVNSAGNTFAIEANYTGILATPRYIESGRDDYGTYYNIAAASGETVTGSNTANITTSICPVGWTIPSISSSAWGGISFTSLTASGKFNVISGAYTGNNSSVASITNTNSNTGFWWSSSMANSTKYYSLSVTNAGVFSTTTSFYNRNYLPIRCILES